MCPHVGLEENKQAVELIFMYMQRTNDIFVALSYVQNNLEVLQNDSKTLSLYWRSQRQKAPTNPEIVKKVQYHCHDKALILRLLCC